MKKLNKNYINNLVSRVLKETLEEKADTLVSKLKSNVTEKMDGMDDTHPKFGEMNFSNMSDEELDDLFKKISNSMSDDEESYDDESEDEYTEMEEGFDDFDMKDNFDDFDSKKYSKLKNLKKHFDFDDKKDSSYEDLNKNDFSDEDEDFMEIAESKDMCSECGGGMYEGECNECGYNMEGIYDKSSKFPKKQSFDYVQEEDDVEMSDDSSSMPNPGGCKAVREMIKLQGKEADTLNKEEEYCGSSSMNENLKGKQKLIDRNKNNKIDAEDFKLLRKGKKVETKEGKTFIQKAVKKIEKKGTEGSFKEYCGGEVTKSCIDKAMKSGDPKLVKKANFAKNIKGYKGAVHKESVKMTESELVNLIEKIITEEQKLKLVGGVPKGLSKYKQVHDKSGKENNDYLKSVTKKMKEYLKDGSKGEYSTEPKIFPKGNGELSKMSKKAYVPSDAVQDYTDNFTAAALENLDYDEIHPNEEWVSNNVEGSSKTGNNPKWANAEETDVNKKRNKIRKDNLLGKLKRKAYNKSPQPVVTDKPGDDKGDKIMTKLESIEPKENKQLNEEFDRMKNLFSYNRKTQ
jgi:hypothetical protein